MNQLSLLGFISAPQPPAVVSANSVQPLPGIRQWKLYLSPDDPLVCLVAFLDIYQEHGKGMGRESSITVPELDRVFRGSEFLRRSIAPAWRLWTPTPAN